MTDKTRLCKSVYLAVEKKNRLQKVNKAAGTKEITQVVEEL
jgi:hypothetical protein